MRREDKENDMQTKDHNNLLQENGRQNVIFAAAFIGIISACVALILWF